ncbi:MAG: TetR/AcrR family transcriptional regulator [Eubacterium sp.]|nr:TetR/AcrR family transcriptional regulator [Eubacterium sp.]
MDKRILKTRKYLRDTLLELMKEEPYKKITVKEICDRSNTGRVTFYNHYDDKYDLLLDCLDEMHQNISQSFKAMQKQKNPDNNFVRTLENLIDTIYEETRKYKGISLTEDPDLMAIYYHVFISQMEDLEMNLGNHTPAKYDQKQLNSFLVLGFWGFLHGNDIKSESEIRRDARRLAKDLAESRIFTIN